LTMSWELDIWGRIRRSNEAARANLFATEDARRGVWLTLVSDLAQAYFELLALDVRLQIARDSTDAYQSTYNVFQDRLQVGVASKLETSRAEGALGAPRCRRSQAAPRRSGLSPACSADRSSTRAAPSGTTGRQSRSGSRRGFSTSRRCSPRSGRCRMPSPRSAS